MSKNSAILKTALHQALELQQHGNLKAAERKYRDILKRSPNHTDALQFLAILQQQAGKPSVAIHFMQKAIKSAPTNAVVLSNQAEVFRLQGEYVAAEDYANQALKQNNQLVDPLVILADIYARREDYPLAIEYFQRALSLNADDVEVRNELGNALSALQRFEEAIQHYQQALAIDPGFDICRTNFADTLLSLNQCNAAIDQYQILLKRQSGNSDLHCKLAVAHESIGSLQNAIQHVETALNQNPESLVIRFNLGRLYLNIEPEKALYLFNGVLKEDKNNAEAYYWIGIYHQINGRFNEASDSLGKAIKLDHDYFDAWYRLSLNRRFVPNQQQLDYLQSKYGQIELVDMQTPTLVPLAFSLAHFLEQKKQYSESFVYYQKANRIKSRQQPFDAAEHDRQVSNIVKTFDEAFFAQRKNWGNGSKLPIFIVGMPRSGTSLLEQILSAHSDVYGGGELPLMLNLTAGLKCKSPSQAISHAQVISGLNHAEITALADNTLAELRSHDDQAKHITDKLPGNYLRLGLIFLLFPNARIIHCQRDPIDTCWSCYQQNFERGLKFSHDLADLAHVYRAYQGLMRHWHTLMPGKIFDIQYEDLLSDPQKFSHQLLDFVGLPWDSTVLKFHRQARPVSTASVWQVRQPIYQTSVGRWKHYRDQLEPLRQALCE